MAKKIVIDELHGAEGKEMSDEDVAELEADTRDGVEGDDPEPQTEITEPVGEDLPEGITEPPEEAPVSEPEVDPEVQRLKDLGLYREGLIENFDDLGKSYKHIEGEFSRRPVVEKPADIQPDPQAMIEELREEMAIDPVSAVAKIANAMQSQNRSEINEIKEGLFYANYPDAKDFKDDINEIQERLPGLGIHDAFDMARGRNADKVIARATQDEKRRATERQVALREKPSGVRTAPVDAAQAVKAAAAGGGSADERVDRMIKVLESQNMGAKD
ncbi:MAG: hypothetical protein ACYTBJ_23525 [Planctomycetota bacterium]